MFDLDRFIDDCRAAHAADRSHRLVREVVARAASEPGGVLRALGEPRRAQLQKLYHAPDLTILNVVWAPMMAVPPHDHRMWAVIGVYTGREDNIFWRRVRRPTAASDRGGRRAVAVPAGEAWLARARGSPSTPSSIRSRGSRAMASTAATSSRVVAASGMRSPCARAASTLTGRCAASRTPTPSRLTFGARHGCGANADRRHAMQRRALVGIAASAMGLATPGPGADSAGGALAARLLLSPLADALVGGGVPGAEGGGAHRRTLPHPSTHRTRRGRAAIAGTGRRGAGQRGDGAHDRPLLHRQGQRLRLRGDRALHAEPTAAERLAVSRQQQRDAGRAVRPLRSDPAALRQHRQPDGGVVPQGNPRRRGPVRAEVPRRRPGRSGNGEGRRGAAAGSHPGTSTQRWSAGPSTAWNTWGHTTT